MPRRCLLRGSNIAYIELVLVPLLDYGQEAPQWLKKISHGIVPYLLRPVPPAVLVVGDDFISRTGRAQPRVTVLPHRPPGISRLDFIGIKFSPHDRGEAACSALGSRRGRWRQLRHSIRS